MKFKRLAAAVSAAAMLGSIGFALPVGAAEVPDVTVWEVQSSDWTLSNDKNNGYGVNNNDGSVTIYADKSNPQQGDFKGATASNNPVCFGLVATSDKTNLQFEVGTEYTVHYTLSGSWEDLNKNHGSYINVAAWHNSNNKRSDNKTRQNIVNKFPTESNQTSITKEYKITPTAGSDNDNAGTVAFAEGLTGRYMTLQFELRDVNENDHVTISNVYVTKKNTVKSVTLASNYDGSKILFNNDTVNLTTTVVDENDISYTNPDGVEYVVQKCTSNTDTNLINASTSGYSITDNVFKLTNTGRDTPGNYKYLSIKAKYTYNNQDYYSEPIKVYVDRQKCVTYKIDKGEGATDEDVNQITASATVNEAPATPKITTSQADWLYSGYMDATMTLTAPEGFIITLNDDTKKYYNSIDNNGTRVVTVNRTKNTTATIAGNDFGAFGTLSKAPAAPTITASAVAQGFYGLENGKEKTDDKATAVITTFTSSDASSTSALDLSPYKWTVEGKSYKIKTDDLPTINLNSGSVQIGFIVDGVHVDGSVNVTTE